MILGQLITTVVSVASAASVMQTINLNPLRIPSKEEAAEVARTLVHRESLMNVNTIHDEGGTKIPVSGMEYYADCDGDGDPYWLVVDIGSTFQNIKNGSPYSFTIRMGDHPLNDYVNPEYPGGISTSPAGSPRLILKGKLEQISTSDPTEILRIERCFLERHPDAKWWLPSNVISPHKTHWTKIYVSGLLMIGGFGDRAYIGSVDSDTYHAATLLD